MVESYKFKSKLANVLVFVAGLISYIGVDGLRSVIPVEYANLVPVIVMVAGYVVVQATENKRVAVAEEIVQDTYTQMNDDYSTDYVNDEYMGDDNGTQ